MVSGYGLVVDSPCPHGLYCNQVAMSATGYANIPGRVATW